MSDIARHHSNLADVASRPANQYGLKHGYAIMPDPNDPYGWQAFEEERVRQKCMEELTRKGLLSASSSTSTTAATASTRSTTDESCGSDCQSDTDSTCSSSTTSSSSTCTCSCKKRCGGMWCRRRSLSFQRSKPHWCDGKKWGGKIWGFSRAPGDKNPTKWHMYFDPKVSKSEIKEICRRRCPPEKEVGREKQKVEKAKKKAKRAQKRSKNYTYRTLRKHKNRRRHCRVKTQVIVCGICQGIGCPNCQAGGVLVPIDYDYTGAGAGGYGHYGGGGLPSMPPHRGYAGHPASNMDHYRVHPDKEDKEKEKEKEKEEKEKEEKEKEKEKEGDGEGNTMRDLADRMQTMRVKEKGYWGGKWEKDHEKMPRITSADLKLLEKGHQPTYKDGKTVGDEAPTWLWGPAGRGYGPQGGPYYGRGYRGNSMFARIEEPGGGDGSGGGGGGGIAATIGTGDEDSGVSGDGKTSTTSGSGDDCGNGGPGNGGDSSNGSGGGGSGPDISGDLAPEDLLTGSPAPVSDSDNGGEGPSNWLQRDFRSPSAHGSQRSQLSRASRKSGGSGMSQASKASKGKGKEVATEWKGSGVGVNAVVLDGDATSRHSSQHIPPSAKIAVAIDDERLSRFERLRQRLDDAGRLRTGSWERISPALQREREWQRQQAMKEEWQKIKAEEGGGGESGGGGSLDSPLLREVDRLFMSDEGSSTDRRTGQRQRQRSPPELNFAQHPIHPEHLATLEPRRAVSDTVSYVSLNSTNSALAQSQNQTVPPIETQSVYRAHSSSGDTGYETGHEVGEAGEAGDVETQEAKRTPQVIYSSRFNDPGYGSLYDIPGYGDYAGFEGWNVDCDDSGLWPSSLKVEKKKSKSDKEKKKSKGEGEDKAKDKKRGKNKEPSEKGKKKEDKNRKEKTYKKDKKKREGKTEESSSWTTYSSSRGSHSHHSKNCKSRKGTDM